MSVGGTPCDAAGNSLLAVFLLEGFSFTSAEDGCFYESCWPMRQEAAALAYPYVVAGLLMVVAALLVRHVRWWLRAVVPAAVWVAALVVQQAVYSPWLLPIFQGPPS